MPKCGVGIFEIIFNKVSAVRRRFICLNNSDNLLNLKLIAEIIAIALCLRLALVVKNKTK